MTATGKSNNLLKINKTKIVNNVVKIYQILCLIIFFNLSTFYAYTNHIKINNWISTNNTIGMINYIITLPVIYFFNPNRKISTNPIHEIKIE